MKAISSWWALCVQFVKFGVVGFANTFISLAIYYGFIFIDKKLYMFGWITGFLVSVMNSYYWNSHYVFGKAREISRVQLAKTFVSYGGTAILGAMFLYVSVNYFAISKSIAPLLILLITVPLNFLLNKFWAFKSER
jgi:putative flippase GtrA